MTTITIPAPCTWINSNQRIHRMQHAKLTAIWRETARTLWHHGTYTEGQIHITCHIYKPHRGRYDPGNLYPTAKACVDGLVEAGMIADDDWAHVIGPDMRHGGIGPAALIITIEPYE
jgi:hypothetical protein